MPLQGKISQLEFTPLEFETVHQVFLKTSRAQLLEFTPLEFETLS